MQRDTFNTLQYSFKTGFYETIVDKKRVEINANL